MFRRKQRMDGRQSQPRCNSLPTDMPVLMLQSCLKVEIECTAGREGRVAGFRGESVTRRTESAHAQPRSHGYHDAISGGIHLPGLQANKICVRESMDPSRRSLHIVDQRDPIGSDRPENLFPIDAPWEIRKRKHDL